MRTGFVVPTVNQIRLTITGQPGAGKSTLLNSNPHLLSLDPERGGDTVADPKALRFTPPPETDPATLDQAYLTFVDSVIARKLRGADDIRMIAIDTIDELEMSAVVMGRVTSLFVISSSECWTRFIVRG